MTTTTTTYGIIYGGEGRDHFEIDGGYASVDEARAAYSAARRISYMDGLLGGATIVELGRDGSPKRDVEALAVDVTTDELTEMAAEVLRAEEEEGGTWRHWDDSTRTWWRVSARSMAVLGRRLAGCGGMGDADLIVSEWCADPTCPAEELVTVEIMPEHFRASHEAAGYAGIEWCGQYPANGALRREVTRDEADELLEEHGDWARVIK